MGGPEDQHEGRPAQPCPPGRGYLQAGVAGRRRREVRGGAGAWREPGRGFLSLSPSSICAGGGALRLGAEPVVGRGAVGRAGPRVSERAPRARGLRAAGEGPCGGRRAGGREWEGVSGGGKGDRALLRLAGP